MQVVTHPQEQLDALVSDIAKRVKVCMYTVVGLISVGAAGMDSHVAMPVTTAGRRGGRRGIVTQVKMRYM